MTFRVTKSYLSIVAGLTLDAGLVGDVQEHVKKDVIHFAGESFVVDPHGRIIAQAPKDEDHILYADCDFQQIPQSHAKKHFLQDRRPDFYRVFDLLD